MDPTDEGADAAIHAATGDARAGVAAPRPIFVVGAGSIVRDAHLPAYRAAGWTVAGVYDRDAARAAEIAREFGLRAFGSREELIRVCADTAGVYDLALPPGAVAPCSPAPPGPPVPRITGAPGLSEVDGTRTTAS